MKNTIKEILTFGLFNISTLLLCVLAGFILTSDRGSLIEEHFSTLKDLAFIIIGAIGYGLMVAAIQVAAISTFRTFKILLKK